MASTGKSKLGLIAPLWDFGVAVNFVGKFLQIPGRSPMLTGTSLGPFLIKLGCALEAFFVNVHEAELLPNRSDQKIVGPTDSRWSTTTLTSVVFEEFDLLQPLFCFCLGFIRAAKILALLG
jgi:hypothetical protein